MTKSRKQLISFLVSILIVGTLAPLTSSYILSGSNANPMSHNLSNFPANQVPLSRVAFVAPNPESYVDEFAYMATVPTSVFHYNNTQYISPLIYSEGSESESWLLDDWAEYLSLDGGITQAIAVGDFSESYLTSLQHDAGVKIYPRITGTSAADIVARTCQQRVHFCMH